MRRVRVPEVWKGSGKVWMGLSWLAGIRGTGLSEMGVEWEAGGRVSQVTRLHTTLQYIREGLQGQWKNANIGILSQAYKEEPCRRIAQNSPVPLAHSYTHP